MHYPDFKTTNIRVADLNSQDVFRGSVDIFVIMDNSAYALGIHPEPDAESQMNVDITNFFHTKKVIRSEIVSDQIIEIDGHNARQIISASGPRPPRAEIPEQTETIINEAMYILDRDRYYIIYFSIPESQRNGNFAEGFDTLIRSIKFIQ